MAISLTGRSLTIDNLEIIARKGGKADLGPESRDRILACRRFLERKLGTGERIYGTNTGVGEFSEVVLDQERLDEFQRRMIYSHAAGAGGEMPHDWVRGAMAARVNVHAQGYSGCRLAVTETLVEMLNRGVTPKVSLKGSVGACGDLAPMAEIALLLLGEGQAWFRGELLPGKEAMERAGIPVPGLKVRDGLATINGSNFITAAGALQAGDMRRILRAAEIACAMSMEALNANLICLDERIHKVRGFQGSVDSAAFILSLLEGGDLRSGLIKTKVQDAYSLRSTPQVLGAARDALGYAESQIAIELNGVGDNPIFIAEDQAILTGANFQGCPVSLPMEMMGAAITSACVLSERRLNRLLDKDLSGGLPMFLVPSNGLNSGLMISQYTANSLIAEQRVLATPAYVGSIPGAGSQEDYVSMGMTTAIKTQQILECAYAIIGIELLAAAQALDLRKRTFGDGVAKAHAAIRNRVEFLANDRVLVGDQRAMRDLVESGELLAAVGA
jgi:histidine ammonia-lyase